MAKKEERQLVNPFSDAFWPHWDLWKDYKWESHKFKYKGVITEQMAIKHLVDLSEGEEEKAIKIINQSIRRQWQGFFPLHETTKPNGNGKSAKQKTGTAASSNQREPESDRLRKEANDEFMRRYGGGEQSSDGSHLKAV